MKNSREGAIAKESGIVLFDLRKRKEENKRALIVNSIFPRGIKPFKNQKNQEKMKICQNGKNHHFLGLYNDICYINSRDIYIAMDTLKRRVIAINANHSNTEYSKSFKNFLLNFKGSQHAARTFKYNKSTNTLFANYDDIKIIHFVVTKNFEFLFNTIELEWANTEKLSDWTLLNRNRVLTLGNGGLLTIHRYNTFNVMLNRISNSYQISSVKDKDNNPEQFSSMAICSKSRFLVVSSVISVFRLARKLSIFSISESDTILRLDRQVISDADSMNYKTERRAIDFLGYYRGFPVFISVDFAGYGSLFLDYYDGNKLKRFKSVVPAILKDETYRFSIVNKKCFMADTQGNLAFVSVMDKKEAEFRNQLRRRQIMDSESNASSKFTRGRENDTQGWYESYKRDFGDLEDQEGDPFFEMGFDENMIAEAFGELSYEGQYQGGHDGEDFD